MFYRSASAFISIYLTLLLASCGGGGGGGGTPNPPPPPPPPPPPDVMVGGLIEAPNGQVASVWPLHGVDRWFALVVPDAAASVPGAAPVPDGTPVDLNRLDTDGSIAETLASTTTSGGRYSFNFTELGLAFDDYYVATAVGGAGIVLRAFVTAETADIDVESETAVGLVLESVTQGAAGTLANFTLQELADLISTSRLIARLSGVTAGIDIPATVADIEAALFAEPGFVTLLASAETPGQTQFGPGDIGTFFPLDNGWSWTFDGTVTVEGISETYKSTQQVEGTRDVNGTMTTVLATTGPEGERIETLLVKTELGLSDWTTVPAGGQASEIVRFPLTPGAVIGEEGIIVDLGEDLDGDGTTESVTADAASTVVGFEDVVVPGGSFPGAVRLESSLTFSGTLSSGGDFTGSAVSNTWHAPGIGPVRSDAELTATSGNQSVTGTAVEELTGGAFRIASGLRNSDEAFGAEPSAGDGYLVFACNEVATPEGFYGTLVPGSGRTGRSVFIGDVHYLAGCQPDSAAVAYDGTNHLFVWAKTNNAGDTHIVGVRIDDDGVALDANEFLVSSAGGFSPAAAFDGTNYLVVWNRFDLSGTGGHEIWGARIAPDGTNLGEFTVFTSPGEQVFPDVAFDGTNFLVVWRDTRSGSGPSADTDVYGVRVSPAGAVLDSPEIAIVTAPRTQGEPKVASSGGNWLVVWSDIGELGTSPPPDGRIFGKRVAADGGLLDGPADADGIAIATAAVANYGAVVDYVGSGYVVVWGVGSYPVHGTAGIYSARVSTDGILAGDPNTLGPSLSGTPPDGSWYVQPRISSSGNEALVTWMERGAGVNALGAVVQP